MNMPPTHTTRRASAVASPIETEEEKAASLEKLGGMLDASEKAAITAAASPAIPATTGRAVDLIPKDEDFPDDFIPIGVLPYSDFWYVREGATIRGELICISRRYETDQNSDEENPPLRLREHFVIKVTTPTICAKTVKDRNHEQIGEIVRDPISASDKDVYVVEPGTLVAFDVRRTLSALTVWGSSKYAAEIMVKVTGREKAERGNRVYWTFKQGVKPLRPRLRDTSLDHLGMLVKQTVEDAPAPF